MKYNFQKIIDAMKNGTVIILNGHSGFVVGIRMEDGSGNNWLVKFHNRNEEVFVRTL